MGRARPRRTGVGALLGSVLMAWGGTVHHAGRLMLWSTLGWFVLLGVFACTPDYAPTLGVLVLMGMAQTMALTNMTILLLGTARSDMRGRVMGLRSLAVASLLLGGTLAEAATTSASTARPRPSWGYLRRLRGTAGDSVRLSPAARAPRAPWSGARASGGS